MRIGYHRKFVRDEDAKQSSKEMVEKRKGLVGGDIEKMPQEPKGLAPHLKFKATTPVEIRAFPDTKEEQEANQKYLAHRPLEIEIGFGDGRTLLHKARQCPEIHLVGFEIKKSFCLEVVHEIEVHQIPNLRVIYQDARQALDALFEDNSIRRCSVLFPDPWWKKRHIKRRVVTPFFLDLMSRKLEPNGILHVKTDVMPYAEAVKEFLTSDTRYEPDDGTYSHNFETDSPSKREAYCLKNNIPFAEFRYILVAKN